MEFWAWNNEYGWFIINTASVNKKNIWSLLEQSSYDINISINTYA